MAHITGTNCTVSLFVNDKWVEYTVDLGVVPGKRSAQETLWERIDPGYIGWTNPLRRDLESILEE